MNLTIYKSRIPSNIVCMQDAIKDVLCFLQSLGGRITEDMQFEMKVILNELILNAVKHGNRGDCNKFVKISAGLIRNAYVVFVIEDEGNGYDHSCIQNKPQFPSDSEIQCMQETGRGIFIVSSLSDKVKFNKKGNRIIVLKKIFQT